MWEEGATGTVAYWEVAAGVVACLYIGLLARWLERTPPASCLKYRSSFFLESYSGLPILAGERSW
jgi:hypothetical protein